MLQWYTDKIQLIINTLIDIKYVPYIQPCEVMNTKFN